MGLFDGLFKSSSENTTSSGIKGDLLEFLKQVDKLYMESYSLKSTRDIAHYLSPNCARKLSLVICSINARYFGDAKYRRTNWSCVSNDGDTIVIRKEVKFDNVKVAGRLSIAVADNYNEVWTVKKDKSYIVLSIAAA